MHTHHHAPHHDEPTGPGGRGGRGGWDRPRGGRSRDPLGDNQRGRQRGRGWGWWDPSAFDLGRHAGGPGGPPFGRGRRRGRGDVRAAIIALLAESPMHGYQVITELTERSGGAWRPSPGSVYPTLQALEDQGLVTAATSEGRRVFSLTDAGREVAAEAAEGPAPWEEAARGADRSLSGIRGAIGDVVGAAAQAARAGNPQQVVQVVDILADARRRIYLVLADGEGSGEPPAGGTTPPAA